MTKFKGKIVFKLEQVMDKKGITEKDLQNGGMNRITLRGLLSGRNTRTDHGVLAQLCFLLDCQPGDLLVYIKE